MINDNMGVPSTPSPNKLSRAKAQSLVYDNFKNGISLANEIPLPVFRTPKMPRYPRIPRYTIEDLVKLLEQLKTSPSENLLMRIKAVLAVLNELPKEGLDLSVLFDQTLKTFNNPEMQNSMFLLLSRLHTIVEPHYMLRLYLDVANDKERQKNYNMTNVDMNYQSFLRLKGSELQDMIYPLTLLEISIDVHEELMNGFELLCKWDSSYSGVTKIYNALKKDPTLSLGEYFDSIEPPFKQFLITGLQQNAMRDNMPEMKPIVEELKKRMTAAPQSSILTQNLSTLSQKMLDVVSENSPMGKKSLPHFVKTPSRYVIEFDKEEEEEEEEDDDEAFISKIRAELMASANKTQKELEQAGDKNDEYEYVYEEEEDK